VRRTEDRASRGDARGRLRAAAASLAGRLREDRPPFVRRRRLRPHRRPAAARLPSRGRHRRAAGAAVEREPAPGSDPDVITNNKLDIPFSERKEWLENPSKYGRRRRWRIPRAVAPNLRTTILRAG